MVDVQAVDSKTEIRSTGFVFNVWQWNVYDKRSMHDNELNGSKRSIRIKSDVTLKKIRLKGYSVTSWQDLAFPAGTERSQPDPNIQNWLP